jgi:hypothetical protein
MAKYEKGYEITAMFSDGDTFIYHFSWSESSVDHLINDCKKRKDKCAVWVNGRLRLVGGISDEEVWRLLTLAKKWGIITINQ